jgi:hypothetical protein
MKGDMLCSPYTKISTDSRRALLLKRFLAPICDLAVTWAKLEEDSLKAIVVFLSSGPYGACNAWCEWHLPGFPSIRHATRFSL